MSHKGTFFVTEEFYDEYGTIRLEEWPEGLILWVNGMIRWKSWADKDPKISGVRIRPVGTFALGENDGLMSQKPTDAYRHASLRGQSFDTTDDVGSLNTHGTVKYDPYTNPLHKRTT